MHVTKPTCRVIGVFSSLTEFAQSQSVKDLIQSNNFQRDITRVKKDKSIQHLTSKYYSIFLRAK